MIDAMLTIWTIYDRPADYPDRFVVACDMVKEARLHPTTDDVASRRPLWFADSLEAARAIVRTVDPTADQRLARFPTDAPCIVECWL